MEKVLIVAKTMMRGFACVGGLLYGANKSVRLLTPGGTNQPLDTPFEVGQVWAIEYKMAAKIVPPHVEDVLVVRKRLLDQVENLRETLLQLIQPWQGGPERLFDGLIAFGIMSGYVSKAQGIPDRSTGYWMPDNQLVLDESYREGKPYYRMQYQSTNSHVPRNHYLYIPYIGFADPLSAIPEQALVRVSLSRWWLSLEANEERCYLQLSGCYL